MCKEEVKLTRGSQESKCAGQQGRSLRPQRQRQLWLGRGDFYNLIDLLPIPLYWCLRLRWGRVFVDDLALKKHKLLLDLSALEAELSRVIRLNAESPLNPEDQTISQDLVAAYELVRSMIAKLQK